MACNNALVSRKSSASRPGRQILWTSVNVPSSPFHSKMVTTQQPRKPAPSRSPTNSRWFVIAARLWLRVSSIKRAEA